MSGSATRKLKARNSYINTGDSWQLGCAELPKSKAGLTRMPKRSKTESSTLPKM